MLEQIFKKYNTVIVKSQILSISSVRATVFLNPTKCYTINNRLKAYAINKSSYTIYTFIKVYKHFRSV